MWRYETTNYGNSYVDGDCRNSCSAHLAGAQGDGADQVLMFETDANHLYGEDSFANAHKCTVLSGVRECHCNQ